MQDSELITPAYRKRSAETRKKISEARKGMVFTAEHKAHLSAAKLGTHLSEEHKEAISNGNQGNENCRAAGRAHKGIPLTAEHKENISKAAKGNPNYKREPSPYRVERTREANIKPGSAFRQLFQKYKSGAKARDLSWELTEDQFRKLTSSSCFYTGREPTQVSKALSGEVYFYNGVDRLDSSKGYFWENCVPCCKEANIAKMGLSVTVFLELVSEIYKHKNGE
jgi:hypothetical protein